MLVLESSCPKSPYHWHWILIKWFSHYGLLVCDVYRIKVTKIRFPGRFLGYAVSSWASFAPTGPRGRATFILTHWAQISLLFQPPWGVLPFPRLDWGGSSCRNKVTKLLSLEGARGPCPQRSGPQTPGGFSPGENEWTAKITAGRAKSQWQTH